MRLAAVLTLLTGLFVSSAQADEPVRASEGSERSRVVRRILPVSVRVQVLSGGEVRRSASGVVVFSEPAGAERPAASAPRVMRECSGRAGAPGRAFVLTNAHVVDPAKLQKVVYRVLVERRGRVERTLAARPAAIGQVPELDLGLLEVDEVLPCAELGREDAIDVGDDVVVVGAPYGRALSVSGGMISQLEAEDAAGGAPLRYRAMKTDAAIGYGSSGGGVFAVPSGRLVGLVEGYRTARVVINEGASFDVPMPGETFVAPISKIRSFLEANGIGMDAASHTAKADAATP